MWWISPLSWLLLAIMAAGISMWSRRWRRALLHIAITVGAIAIFAMTPLFANLLLARLENAEVPSPDCVRMPPDVAVVLAGGIYGTAADADDPSVLDLSSRQRLDRAVAWWNERDGRTLILSGGAWFDDGIPDSRRMRRYARQRGVPESAMRSEDVSRTTWQSAQQLARLQPALPRRVALITSASHMPRATYAMREAGYEVCQVATDRLHIPPHWPGVLLPQRSALEKSEIALHELIGLLYYRMRFRRDGSA
jgi:uncharacterized SAM-binding protein YcdF (DUF218 family)